MRRLVVATLVAFSCLAAISGASASVHRHGRPTLILLVVGGQSNAVGFQSFVIDPKTHKNVFTEKGSSPADRKVLFTFQESGIAGGHLPPVSLDSPQKLSSARSVFGPEVGLARNLYSAGHKNLLVVKVAFSGSSLAEDWSPLGYDLSLLVTRVQDAETWATDHGWSPTIGGFYWMQGERDATVASYAASYRKNLLQFISVVRKDLVLRSTTPFVIGQIDLADYIHFEQVHHKCKSLHCTSEKRWNAEVMKAEASVTSKSVFLAKTATLARYQDFLHLTDASELTLGYEFASLSQSHL